MKPDSFVITNGRGSNDTSCELIVKDGQFAREEDTRAERQIIDAAGAYILPGLIDIHVHYRDPWIGIDRPPGENLESGLKAALNGGVTSSACMPNTAPVIDKPAIIRDLLERADTLQAGRLLPIAALTIGRDGKELVDFEGLLQAGAIGFSDDGSTLMDPHLVKEALRASADLGFPVITHSLDEEQWPEWQMHEGDVSRSLGFAGTPGRAESDIVERDIELARQTGGKLHICHVSVSETVEAVRRAKEAGIQVTCEVAPHHLLFTEDDVAPGNPLFKMSPPLRSIQDRDALRAGLASGIIDIIASDHAPHPAEFKSDFKTAFNGITGIETMLYSLMHDLAAPGIVSFERIIDALTAAPAQLLNIEGGSLNAGNRADLCIFDPEPVWECKAEFFKSQSMNTPFIGRQLQGTIQALFVAGKRIDES